MKLLEIIDTIYPQVIEKFDFDLEDQQFEVCKTLTGDYTYFIKISFDRSLNPSIYILDFSIETKDEVKFECDLPMLTKLFEQKLNLYYDELTKYEYEN